MKYFFQVLKNYAVFKGRARRAEYWQFILWQIVLEIAITIVFGISSALLNADICAVTNFIFIAINALCAIAFLVMGLGLIIPSLAVMVRRLHDIGKSGWWYFISLVPLAGPIILIIFLCTDSQPGENEYGPDPKEFKQPMEF